MKKNRQKMVKRSNNVHGEHRFAGYGKSGKGYLESVNSAYLSIALVGLILIVYAQTISFGYSGFDDEYLVKDNIPVFQDISNLKNFLTQDVFLGKQEVLFYRPIQAISYMFDTVVGGPKPSSYHASNLIIHCLASCALLSLLLLLKFRKLPSFFFSALFALHPIFVQSVSWIPSRGDLLICLFWIMTCIFYMKYAEKGRVRDLLFHELFFLLSVFSKETAVLLPLVLIAFSFLTAEGKVSGKKIFIPGIMWMLILFVWFVLRNHVIREGASASIVGMGPLLWNLPTIPELLSKFIVPIGLAPMPLFSATGIFGGAIVIIAVSAWAVYSKLRDWRVLFGIAWFIVFLIPGLWFRHPLGAGAYDYLSHRLYLPAAGLIITLLALGAIKISENNKTFIIAGAVIILACGIDSALLARNYAEPMKFYNYAIKTNPECALAYNNRGDIQRISGQYENAMSDFDEAIRLAPKYPEAYRGRGEVYLRLGDIFQAEGEFTKAIEYNANYYDALNGRGRARDMKGNRSAATADFTEAIRIRPNSFEAYINRGNIYESLGQFAAAEADYSMAIRLQPDCAQAYTGLGGIRAKSGNIDEAMKYFTKSIQVDPASAAGYNGRGIFKSSLKDYKGAIADLNEAIRLAPGSLELLTNRGVIYENMGDHNLAMNDLAEVIRLSPGNVFAYRDRAVIRHKTGDKLGACADWTQAAKLGDPDAATLLQQLCK
jgi:tetratricopeptide (TPR) repeat protein